MDGSMPLEPVEPPLWRKNNNKKKKGDQIILSSWQYGNGEEWCMLEDGMVSAKNRDEGVQLSSQLPLECISTSSHDQGVLSRWGIWESLNALWFFDHIYTLPWPGEAAGRHTDVYYNNSIRGNRSLEMHIRFSNHVDVFMCNFYQVKLTLSYVLLAQ